MADKTMETVIAEGSGDEYVENRLSDNTVDDIAAALKEAGYLHVSEVVPCEQSDCLGDDCSQCHGAGWYRKTEKEGV